VEFLNSASWKLAATGERGARQVKNSPPRGNGEHGKLETRRHGGTGSRGSAKVEETRRMSDLLCVPCRSGWQVGISERRKLCRPRRRIAAAGKCPHSASWKLAATWEGDTASWKLAATWEGDTASWKLAATWEGDTASWKLAATGEGEHGTLETRRHGDGGFMSHWKKRVTGNGRLRTTFFLNAAQG
jgi:hypothetical protein